MTRVPHRILPSVQAWILLGVSPMLFSIRFADAAIQSLADRELGHLAQSDIALVRAGLAKLLVM